MTEHEGAERKDAEMATSPAAGTCPDCGGELQKGYLVSGGGLSWSPTLAWIVWKGSLIATWFKKGKRCITKVAAYNVPADRCRKCSLLVVRY